MAQLKETSINGDLKITGTLSKIFSNDILPSEDDIYRFGLDDLRYKIGFINSLVGDGYEITTDGDMFINGIFNCNSLFINKIDIMNEVNIIKSEIVELKKKLDLILSDSSNEIININETPIQQQYSLSHEAEPNNPNPASGNYNWNNKPRINPDGPFPQSSWNAIGHWMTSYLEKGASYYDNVGILLQNPKMWIWNTSTSSWDVLSDDFEWGTWYLEDFWNDGNGNISNTTLWETGEGANHSKWVIKIAHLKLYYLLKELSIISSLIIYNNNKDSSTIIIHKNE